MLFALLILINLYITAGQKSGLCPIAYGGTRDASTVDRCQDDYQCPGQRKCCETLIGKACMLPEVGTAMSTTSGYYGSDSVCPTTLPATFSRLDHVCFADADCKGGRRCCRYGSVRRCLSVNTMQTNTAGWSGQTTATPYQTTTRPTGSKPSYRQRCTGENEEYSDCAPLCPKGCDNLHDKPNCSGCKPGCKCKRGFHRLVVDDARSPCVANQVCLAMTSKENCPDGTVPQAVCRGKYKSCPAGTTCNNGLCCPPFERRPQQQMQKPGHCPTSPPRGSGHLARCNNDFQCYGIEKCCPSYNGQVCMSPAETSAWNERNPSNRQPGGNPNILGGVMDLLGLGNLGNLMNVG